MAEEKEYDLKNPQHLLDFLTEANIRLVRLEYLHHLEREKRLWPRRQEAEHETFQDQDGLMKTALVRLQEYKQLDFDGDFLRLEGDICFVESVSHCWEAKQHPDPFRLQAVELLAQLGVSSLSVWVFIDFVCLPQYYRTPEEEVFFNRAMANMHVLYAHRNVFNVLRVEKLADERAKASPQDFIDIYYEDTGAEPGSGKFGPQPFYKLEFNDTPYHERGWCEAEKQWMSTKEDINGFAPMIPARFRERVERGHQNFPDGLVLKFTHRSDEELVVKLQEKIFLQQAHRRKILVAKQLPQAELLLLAESLPYFVHLEMLMADYLDFQEASAVALIAGLKPLRHLKDLGFQAHCGIDEEAAATLAHGLLECHFAEDLRVTVWNGSGCEKLTNHLRRLKKTGRLRERSNALGTCFIIKAPSGAEVGRQCWQLEWLWRRLSNLCW